MAEERTISATGGQKGVKLARFDLLPAGPLNELAVHYGRGARKYASHQWRQGYEWSKSIGALGRHYNDFMAGKDYDVCSNEPDNCKFTDNDGNEYVPQEPDTCYNHTGSHHMVAVAWHSFLLLEFKDHFPQFDDRFKYAVEEVDNTSFWEGLTSPRRLQWEHPPTRVRANVCICTEDERAAQATVAEHYEHIHGILL